MKSSVLIAVSLTLLMLLMVLVAGFVFLFQNQRTLEQQQQAAQEELTILQQKQAETEIQLLGARATQTPAAAALATSQAESFLLDQQLVTSEQMKQALDDENNGLKGDIEGLSAERDTINEALNRYEAQGPLLNVISPMQEATVLAGQTVTITIAASDLNDVTEVTVHVEDEQLDTLPITKGPIVTVDAEWVAAGSGLMVMTITAVNANGIISELTVPVIVLTPTAPPTATTTSTPTPTSTPTS